MPIVLIVAAQQPDGHLRKATLNAISAGRTLAEKAGAELHLVLLSKDPSKLAEELKVQGVKAVHTAAAQGGHQGPGRGRAGGQAAQRGEGRLSALVSNPF